MPWMFQQFAKPGARLCAAGVLLFVLIACLHREVLWQGAIYHMDDAADNYYPARVAFRRALYEGSLPGWEPNAMSGWPLLSDPYYGYFYPLNFVFYLGPKKSEPPSGMAGGVAQGLGVSAALHAFLAGIGMYVYLRGRRRANGQPLHFGAALFGAIAFALSSFLVVRIRHIIYVQMMAWVPFLLAAIDRYLETRTLRMLGACALCTGMLLLCGAHSLLHFMALLIVSYALAGILGKAAADKPHPSPGGRLPELLRTTLGLSLAALCGALLAAVALLPTLLAMPHSARALGTDYTFASTYAWPNWSYIRLLWQPDRLGIGEWRGAANPWHGPFNHWELAGYYQGIAAVILALPGAFLAGRRNAPVLIGLLLVCGIGVLIALGDAGPLHPFLYKHLPLYAALRCPARALCMLVVALPILGAHAADALAARLPGRYASTLFLGILCAGTAADEYRTGRGYVQPKPIDFAYGTERFAALNWLSQKMPQLPAESPARFVPDGRGPFRLLSAGETLGLESASGYSSMLVWRYVHLLYILNHGQTYPFARLRYDPAALQFLRLGSPLVDMMNIRYLIASAPPSTKWIERFSPPRGTPPQTRYEPLWDSALRVYENRQVMPRAYMAYQARVAKSQSEEAAYVAAPDFDPHREIVLGLQLANSPQTSTPKEPLVENRNRPHGPVTLRSYSRHQIRLEAEVAAPGVLVLADTYFPGWSAQVDGVTQPIWPVNLAQRGVALLPGHHRIEMIYRDRGLRLGGILSGLGFVMLLIMFFLPLKIFARAFQAPATKA